MPSAVRNQKELPEWIEPDYHRRPRGLRRWRWRLTWLTLLLSAALVGAVSFVPRAASLAQAGPVTPAHALCACADCHTEPFATAKRLLPWNAAVRAVPDSACSQCHDGPRHNEQMTESPHCATCHREHRGHDLLARVGDRHCTTCHADLKGHHRQPESCAFDDVSGFPSGHPEMRLWRGTSPRAPGGRDPRRLKFSHDAHLRPDGLPMPGGKVARLDCGSCHVTDDRGHDMQPVRYEQHCAACHPLSVRLTGDFQGPELRKAADAFARQPAPHRAPVEVRAALRERLIGLTHLYPLVESGPEGERFLPGPRPVTEAEWRWVKRQLTDSEALLFTQRQQRDGERQLFGLSGGCAFCHVEKGQDHAGLPLYEPTRPPGWPRRWLTSARFDHRPHQMVACAECHTPPKDGDLAVRMPKIDLCAQCHNPRAGARSDCVACHQYHPRGGPEAHPRRTVAECLGR
jgi:hypothetical protein